MSQKNETLPLLLALLVTLGLVGGGLWFLGSRLDWGRLLTGSGSPGSSSGNPSFPGTGGGSSTSIALGDRFSGGERLLDAQHASSNKQAGIAAIAAQNYPQAVAEFEASLAAQKNDPEALIYLNNARIGDQLSYTIAVAAPIATSPDPALEILRGVAQAQTEINQAGGINNAPLRVVIVSDDDQPDVATSIAQALVQDSSVLGVIGHFGSSTTLAAADVYQNGNLVMVSPTSTSVEISNKGDYVFRTTPSDRFTANTLARYQLERLQRQNAVIFYNGESDYSLSLKNEFITAVTTDGGQVVDEVDVRATGFDAKASLDRAKQQGAEVLVLATNTATLEQALQIVAANNRQLPLLGGDSLFNPRLLEQGQANAEGMVVAVPWLLDDRQSAFAQTSRQLWGGDVNWRTAMAYDATLALVEGLKRNPTRSGIQQALLSQGFQFQGATGTVRFLPSGDRNQAAQLARVEPGSRSSYGYDFVPER